MSRRLAVTGAGGFVGRAVTQVAGDAGWLPVALIRAAEAPPPSAEDVRIVDWPNDASLADALADCEAVIHAVGATPRTGVDTPADYYEANATTVWRLLSALLALADRPRVVIISSAAVYGTSAGEHVREDSPLRPSSHYGMSKLVGERVAEAFHSVDGLYVSVARLFNILGPEEPADSVVGTISRQLDGEVVRLRETRSIRDFVDVEDAAGAMLTIIERGEPGRAYNVCSGSGTTVRELLEAAIEVWGTNPRVSVECPEEAGTVSVGDSSALRALGWEPCISLRESLERIRAELEG